MILASNDKFGGPDFPSGIRRATLDLSGFAFRIGFKVRLF